MLSTGWALPSMVPLTVVGVARGYVVAVSDRDSFDPNTLIVRYVTDLILLTALLSTTLTEH